MTNGEIADVLFEDEDDDLAAAAYWWCSQEATMQVGEQ